MNWKKALLLTFVIVVGVLATLTGAAYLAAHTEAFNRFVLAKVVEKAEAATGAPVSIKRMDIHWRKLGVDFYDVAISGTAGATEPPLFRADHLGIGLKIVSALKRKIDLSDIVLDEPVVDLQIDAHGATNIPKSPSPAAPSNPVDTAFNMAIGHVLINAGRIYYDDRQIPLSADLRDFQANVKFSVLAGQYQGSLGYDHARIVAKDFDPVEHAARLKFAASRSQLDIEPMLLTVGNSRLTAHATLVNYANPDIQGTYDAVLFTQEIARILKNPSLPSGQVSMAGSLRYRNIPDASFLDAAYIDGRISSSLLTLRASQVSADARSVRGAFSLEKGSLRVQDLDAELLQGHLSANGEVKNLAGRSSTRLAASLKGVSLDAVSRALPPGSYDRLNFIGRADVSAEASWPGSIHNIVAHAHVTVSSPAHSPTGHGRIPLNGVVDVRYDASRDFASFGQSHLQTGTTQVSLSGTLGRQSNLLVQCGTSDLHEVAALVSEIGVATAKPSRSATGSKPFDIQGSAVFSGQVTGSPKTPRLQGQLSASNLQAEGGRWRSFHTSLTVSPSNIALKNAALVGAQQGQINFSGEAGLDHWSFKPSSPLSADVRAINLNVAELERLAQRHYPIIGTLSGNVALRGSEQSLGGQGSVRVVKASAWGEPVEALALDFKGNGNSLQSTAQLHIPAGDIDANLTFSPQSGEYQLSVHTSGLKLGELHAVQARDLGIAGALNLTANGRGTLRDPQLSAHLQIAQLQIRDQSVSDAEAQLAVAHQHANFTLQSVIAHGKIEANGDVELAGQYNGAASVDVRQLPIGPLLAGYLSGSQPGLQGQTEIHAQLHGPLKKPSQIEAHVEIPTFNIGYQAADLALVRPLRLDYRGGIATLQQTEFKGTGTDLTLQGVIPLRSTNTAFNIAANGGIDLSLLQTLTKGLKSSGRVELALTGQGSDFNHPALHGHLRIENAYLSTDSVPVGIEGLNGVMNVSGNRIDIGQLTGAVGGGTLSAQGYMTYGSQASFNLGLQGKSIRVRYPEGLRSVVDCNLQLNGNEADSTLSGRVVFDRLSFTQQFDLANFASQFNGTSVASTLSVFQQNMKVNVAIQSARDVDLVSSQLSMQGAANLNLTGTMANPVILGRVNLTGGDVFFLGKRYEVRNGTIEFSNPTHTEAIVNLYVATTVDQYNITLNFIGPVEQLRTTYTSDPPLPPSDIINLLALGQTAEESAQSTTPASVGAESVIAQGVASQVSGKIQKLAGISQLTIDPMAGNNQVNPGAQVAIQQRVTGNILLTFSTDVTSTQSTTVQLQYRTSRQTSVTVLRDQNGGYAVDLRLHKSF